MVWWADFKSAVGFKQEKKCMTINDKYQQQNMESTSGMINSD